MKFKLKNIKINCNKAEELIDIYNDVKRFYNQKKQEAKEIDVKNIHLFNSKYFKAERILNFIKYTKIGDIVNCEINMPWKKGEDCNTYIIYNFLVVE